MRVLAIETSCDETAVCALECTGDTTAASFTVLANELYSQAHLHAEYGGVFPTLAKREHQKNLPILLEKVLRRVATATGKSGWSEAEPRTFSAADATKLLNIDLIAVTQGPGLEPALWQGIEFARQLSQTSGIPVIGMDHMEGHIVSGLAKKTEAGYELSAPHFPVLALLISGGHTELVLMRQWFEYELIGRTKDDAVGEAFDKVARLLGLPYPGGPEIDKSAARARARGATAEVHGIVFPRPMLHDNTCDFSFSGLKTAVLYKLRDMHDISEETKENIAEAFQTAACEVIIRKTGRALDKTDAHMVVVGGGVSANEAMRHGLLALIEDEFQSVKLSLPDKTLTCDNALMIGMAAYLRHSLQKDGNELVARGSQSLAQVV